jgi:Ser-tRNA(Ala) deacylase AlaX
MSISVPRTITKDWRGVEQEDVTANRRIAIKNIQRETREMAPQWEKMQKNL